MGDKRRLWLPNLSIETFGLGLLRCDESSFLVWLLLVFFGPASSLVFHWLPANWACHPMGISEHVSIVLNKIWICLIQWWIRRGVVLSSWLHGHRFIQVVDLQCSLFEIGHVVLQWLSILLIDWEEAIRILWHSLAGEVNHKLLLQLSKGVDAL